MRPDAPTAERPVVLAVSGHDPGGGAGIQADIETLGALGCHPATAITAVTVQDTRAVYAVATLDAMRLVEQARAVLEDLPVAAIKVGMLGSVAAAEAVHSVLRDHPHLPVVIDPVLEAGGGGTLAEPGLRDAIAALLLPLTTVLTPNIPEALALAPEADNPDACAMALLDRGCRFVLVTGAHEPGARVVNRLYGEHRLLDRSEWERLPGEYHGSGCTLAAALAGFLAQGRDVPAAARAAQRYTWEALRRAYRPGRGQYVPERRLAHAADD